MNQNEAQAEKVEKKTWEKKPGKRAKRRNRRKKTYEKG